jgi:hypothetical protein
MRMPPPSRTRDRTAAEVFAAFLKLGLTLFGGPIAHLGYFRSELVERRRWLPESAYADLIGICQFLPGPASSQAGFALGLMRADRVEGVYKRPVELASGRYTLIERSREFTLVPWRPVLDRHLARPVSGIATRDKINWTIGRQRSEPSVS